MCGADVCADGLCGCNEGSSPRVRGRRHRVVEHAVRVGLIPACAGQTRPSSLARTARRAHPRVCGADLMSACLMETAYGSSPRVRGRRHHVSTAETRHGLIPACAGQTDAALFHESVQRAHPRVCGADGFRCAPRGGAGGSSPRVRGRLKLRIKARVLEGLIPACAGQTGVEHLCRGCDWAHPRVCGADDGRMFAR